MRVKPKRTLGIDFGIARLGLAISDERKVIASPLITFQADKRTEKTVKNLLDALNKMQEDNHYEIDLIVVGLPLMMSGKMGVIADEVKHFVSVLSQSTSIPIITWDERLTTVQAERSLRESSLTRKRRSQIVDIVSAAIILQSYLDSRPGVI
jgi:putative holliday junction resolvase